MTKRKVIIEIILVILMFLVVVGRIVYVRGLNKEYYEDLYLKKSITIVEGKSAPRGRILDRNGVVLVDNVGFNTILFHEVSGIDKYEIALKLVDVLEYENTASLDLVKKFYIETSDDKIVSDEVINQYELRKITKDELYELKFNALSDNIINNYSSKELKAIHLYFVLNTGYKYEAKEIKEDVTEEECAIVSESNIPGVTCELSWKRVYNYEDYLRSIYGGIGLIPSERKDEYLSLGNALDDVVGISNLEYQYESYLKGTKAKYQVNSDGTLTLLSEEKRGSDIYLSIDINLQMEVNEVIKNNLIRAKTLNNTEYYNHSYVLISDPSTGSIIAASGIELLGKKDDYTFKDITSNFISSSYTVGSIVKGASMAVGYQNDLIEIGKKINDSCVKLKNVPTKCSHRSLGLIDDITALKTSSNYYQFLLAIKLTGHEYSKNIDIGANENHFNIYRNTFKSFGLGAITGIDLPNEMTGITGKTVASDLLLNLSIGQYDTYTPAQVLQYINTISQNGVRNKLNLVSKIVSEDGTVLYEYKPVVLNRIEDTGYFERIKEGFRQVLDGGTGRGYTPVKYNPAGKTGTSETYYSNEITTITQTYVMFAPVDNPKYSMVVFSPNISYQNAEYPYIASTNRWISNEVSKILFENY